MPKFGKSLLFSYKFDKFKFSNKIKKLKNRTLQILIISSIFY